MLSSLQALHRDLHEVQDAIDEIVVVVGEEEAGPTVRKPTIIEEMPGPMKGPDGKEEGGRGRVEKALGEGGAAAVVAGEGAAWVSGAEGLNLGVGREDREKDRD